MEYFFWNWKQDKVTMHGATIKLTEEFIAEITGLPMEGIKYKKDTSILNAMFKQFLKNEKEEKRLVKEW